MEPTTFTFVWRTGESSVIVKKHEFATVEEAILYRRKLARESEYPLTVKWSIDGEWYEEGEFAD